MHRRLLTAATFMLCLFALGSAQAQGANNIDYVKDSGDYQIRFSAMPSSDIAAETARQFDITRAANMALVTVQLRHKASIEPLGRAVAANVEVAVSNLSGQSKTLTLREVREGEAIYYLGQLRVSNQERIRFDFTLRPKSEPATKIEARFERTFYVD